MESKIVDKLERITQKIKAEKEIALDTLISDFASLIGGGTMEEFDHRGRTEKDKIALLTLHTIRIDLYVQLICSGEQKYKQSFQEDWKQIIDCVLFLSYGYKVTSEVVSDSVDLISLLHPELRRDLIGLLDMPTRIKVKNQFPLSNSFAQIAEHMLEYCIENRMLDELLLVSVNLVKLSERRNISAPDNHRSIVAHTMWYTVDADAKLTCQIGDKYRRCFDGVEDLISSRFYWLYGSAKSALQQAEEAKALLCRCQGLCDKVEGKRSWIGARAGALYNYALIATDEREQAECFLRDLIEKIDDGFYENMDSSASFVRAFSLYVILLKCLNEQTLKDCHDYIQRFSEYCYDNANIVQNPCLTVREAENFWSGYYWELGEYLEAAEHTSKALEAVPPNGLEPLPSDDLLYTNLLSIYSQINDTAQMVELMDYLSDRKAMYEGNRLTYYRISLLLLTAEKKLGLSMTDYVDEYRKELRAFYRDIHAAKRELQGGTQEKTAYSLWIFEMMSTILDTFTSNRSELSCYREIALWLMDKCHFNGIQNMAVCLIVTQIEWRLHSEHTLDWLDKCLSFTALLPEFSELKISVFRLAAVIYNDMGMADMAKKVVSDALACITRSWQNATAYLNDHRVCQMLSYVQFHFGICYSILRLYSDDKTLYEQVLRFKDLPSLVGRERNRILKLKPVDEELKQDIFRLQDRLASAEMLDSMQGGDSAGALAAQLRQLETEFAKRFPQNNDFVDISFDHVAEKLPEASAIVEYYFSSDNAALSPEQASSGGIRLDIFVTKKKDGKVSFYRLEDDGGDTLLEQSSRFTEIMQNHGDYSRNAEKEGYRANLYRRLIEPVLPYLMGVKDIYIAPDLELCNLPFEILYSGASGTIQEKFSVCRLTCGRDLLFDICPAGPCGSSFVLGAPDYDDGRNITRDSWKRGTSIDIQLASPLPFSGVEAERVSQKCKTVAYTGKSATKKSLLNSLPCRIIHLATHGAYDETMESDSLYSSYLVLAGYNGWVIQKGNGLSSENGILTADEISRMDLSSTELVVLSACQSGLGDVSFGGTQGLLSAFSAAGVRWIVSHMWKADDFSAPVFMDIFYDYYINKCMTVPDALQHSKNRLRDITVGELRRSGWFDDLDSINVSEEVKTELLKIRNVNERRKPFSDEYFWGGFVCHRCK